MPTPHGSYDSDTPTLETTPYYRSPEYWSIAELTHMLDYEERLVLARYLLAIVWESEERPDYYDGLERILNVLEREASAPAWRECFILNAPKPPEAEHGV